MARARGDRRDRAGHRNRDRLCRPLKQSGNRDRLCRPLKQSGNRDRLCRPLRRSRKPRTIAQDTSD
jgi:hypothetical protein